MKNGKIRNNPVEINQSSGVGDPLPDLPSLLREADNKVIVDLTKKGWVLLHRRFWDDEDFPAEPFTELQAWAWLFSEACYEDKHVHFQNRAIPLKRGQLATTIRILAKRFKWGRVKADSFLRKLEKFGKILRQPKDRDYTILTICKYDTYQIPQDNEKTMDRPTRRQPEDNPQPRLNNTKEKKEIKELPADEPPTLLKADPTYKKTIDRLIAEINLQYNLKLDHAKVGLFYKKAESYGQAIIAVKRALGKIKKQNQQMDKLIPYVITELKPNSRKYWREVDWIEVKSQNQAFDSWLNRECGKTIGDVFKKLARK